MQKGQGTLEVWSLSVKKHDSKLDVKHLSYFKNLRNTSTAVTVLTNLYFCLTELPRQEGQIGAVWPPYSTSHLAVIYFCLGLISTPWMSVFSYKLRTWNKFFFWISIVLTLRNCQLHWKQLTSLSQLIFIVQLLSCVRLFVTPWIAACQASLSITNSRSSLKLTSIKSVMPSSHLILCRPLLLLPPIPPSIRVFSRESTLRMRWPKYWSFSFSIIPSKEIPGLISFRMDWLDLLAVQGTLKSLL